MIPIDFAKSKVGLQEVRDNKALKALFKQYAVDGDILIDPATTPWCAAFMNVCLRAAGKPGNGRLNAQSFLAYGEPIKTLQSAQRGDLLIFARGGSTWQGHITFFDGIERPKVIRCLGGNQGDAVSYSFYGADRLLGIRRP